MSAPSMECPPCHVDCPSAMLNCCTMGSLVPASHRTLTVALSTGNTCVHQSEQQDPTSLCLVV